jgi:prepilin-type N-terminal cleavage/methylation domain-containing protein
MNSSSDKSLQVDVQKGFTLIEILIVVGIIGLLASVVLSGLGSVRGRGRDARRIADLRSVQQGLELYYTRCQHYPGGSQCDEGTTPSSWTALKDIMIGSGLGITAVPSDPLYASDPSKNYKYAVRSDEQGYILEAVLEDQDANSPIYKDAYRETPSGFGGMNVNCSAGGHYCIRF